MAKKTGSISNVKGATVFIDKNGDGVWNEGEVKAVADDNGNFQLEGKGKELKGTLVASGGTNLTTGVANTETFMAPQATKVVNSLTTLVAQVAKEQGLSMGKAAREIKEALGLKMNVLTKDPATVAETGKAGSSAVTKALAALEVQKQVDTVLKLGASTLAGVGAGTATAQAGLLSALVEKVASGAPLDLTSGTLVSQVLTAAATKAGLDATATAKVATLATDAAAVIVASTAKIAESIATVTSLGKAATATALDAALTKVVNVETVAATVSGALQTGAAGGSLTSVVDSYTGDALDDLVVTPPEPPVVDPVTPPVVNPPVDNNPPQPAATFMVTESSSGSKIWTLSTGNGNVEVTDDGTNYVFTPATGTAVSKAKTNVDKIIVNTITLTGTAAHLSGETIEGTGTVAITDLNATTNANLANITATTVTANVAGDVTFTGNLGKAAVTVASGTMNVNSATIGDATFSVASGAVLAGPASKLSGVPVAGAGGVTLSASDQDADFDGGELATLLGVALNINGFEIDLSQNETLASIDSYWIGEGKLTLSAEQASGKVFADPWQSGQGNLVIKGLTENVVLSGINALPSGSELQSVTGTVTASVDLTNVDLTKLTALFIGADDGDVVTATVSPQQYAAWKDAVTVGDNDFFKSSDEIIPTTTITSAAYDEDSNTLTITGTDFDTLLESGEDASTDIRGRLDWNKLTWDINGDDDSTTNVSFELSDIASAKATDATTLTIKLTDAKGAALEGTSDFGATGNADTLDIAVGFARDISDNAATTDALSDGVITIQADAVAPTASVATATIGQSGNALVQSNELGTAYLVNTSVTVTNVASITGANDNLWNQVTINNAGTPTNLAATGLLEGSYKVYAVDAAGNLSAASTNTVTVDTTAPTVSAVTIPNEAMKIGDVVTATITVDNATGETLVLKEGSTIGGFTLGSLAKTNDTTYTATFTVAAEGADVAAGSTIPVSIALVDPAGNESTEFTTAISQNADAIDANAPNAPAALDLAVADDSGVSNSDNLTKNTSALTISGTAEADSTVVLYDTDGTTELGSGTATGGNFSIDVSLTEGSHSLTAKTTDTAGNVSVASDALAVIVDTTAPSVAASALAYAEASNTLTVTATGLASLLETGEDATTDIKARIDWTKLAWDIGNDDTDSVTFTVDDISSAKVTASDTLTIVLDSTKASALEGTTGFGGNDDYLDVASDFFGDSAGNVQAHEALTAPITITPAPDETSPNSTITSATYNENGGYLSITGTNFDSILESGENYSTDIKARLDWTKLSWDINGDDDSTANISFTLEDIASVSVASASFLSIRLTETKADAVKATAGYGSAGNNDKIDVTAGFICDLAGNPAITDARSDGSLSVSCSLYLADNANVSPTASAVASVSITPQAGPSGSFVSAQVNAANIASTGIGIYGAGGSISLSNIDTANTILTYFPLDGTANITASGSGLYHVATKGGNDVITSTNTAQTTFVSGGGNDDLTGGSGDDGFQFVNANFTADDSIDGGLGEDNLWIQGAATITDAQFTNVTSIGSLALDGGQTHSIILGPHASAAFDNSHNTNPINISIMNGVTATSITLDAAAATDAISISNKPNTGSAGAMEVAGGSGDDMFIFGDGTATVHFAATAAANGDDNIYIAAANNTVTLDFSAFLSTTNGNTTAVNFVDAGLDLSGANNLGIVFNKAALFDSDIAISAATNKIAVADNGKAVVLCASAADANTYSMSWNIYYIEDTDTGGSQTWAVTLVGQVYADGLGATATEIGTMTFA